MSDSSSKVMKQIAWGLAVSAASMGVVLLLIVSVAKYGGYPEYGRSWLLYIVAPTFVSSTLVLTLILADIPLRDVIRRG